MGSLKKNIEKKNFSCIKGDDQNFVANFYHGSQSLRLFLRAMNYDTSHFLSGGFQHKVIFNFDSIILKPFKEDHSRESNIKSTSTELI